MRSAALLLSTLAGSALALPGLYPRGVNSTTPSHTPTHSHPVLSTGGNGGDSHTVTAPGGSGTVTSTITDTITKTTFKPCSTPVHTQDGTTYYSSWVTASTYETTTCYTTTAVLTNPPAVPTTMAKPHTTGAGTETCPPPSTVTVYVAVGDENGKSGSGIGHNCKHCETITYTNTHGHSTTIVIPPIKPTASETEKTTVEETSTPTNKPTGTGSHTKPAGTGNGPAPTETKTWHTAHKVVRN
ncbi:hypothetical protein BDV25DRAFT_138223 [Aspergillus avenaceus]|uniref:Extracellular proline-rich protein n=1 Tax=Aspergillus avenaceus TaxID=36643 RepID=A0A5N6U0D8_ASPAV|nr:hypothetical protein BDV25DRAFT_138223 [Aspergillus avenaceus]